MKKYFIVTNNLLVRKKYPVTFIDGEMEAVFLKVRDFTHKGHKILTHPLTGSIKPHETEYKSTLIELDPGEVDYMSLELIENAIATVKKLKKPIRNWDECTIKRIDNDFQTVDLALITAGIESLETGGKYKLSKLK